MIIKKKSSFKGSSKGNSLIKLSDNNGDIEKGVEIDEKSSLLLDKAPPITTVWRPQNAKIKLAKIYPSQNRTYNYIFDVVT